MKEGFVLWLTGLPGAGKTTIAKKLAEELKAKGHRVEIMDGDEVRRNLSPELGFSKEDREQHVKRVAYISKLLARNGVAVIVGLISPYRETRKYARELIGNGFYEVYVNCPVEVCMKRDPKGLYKKALAGEITDFTGVQDPYEPPLNPELVVNTDKEELEESVLKILNFLKERGKV